MKLPTLVLIGSLAANGVLAGVYFTSRGGDALRSTTREQADGVLEREAAAPSARSAADNARLAVAASELVASKQLESLGAILRSGNGEELARVLRAAGVSEELVRALVREQIQFPYRARIRAIEDAARGDRPWWQSAGRLELTTEQRAEIRGLQRGMREDLERVFGPDEAGGNRGGNYAFLSADKADAARQIDADYNDMARELREHMNAFRLPSDRDALRLLEEERRADLASMLSPAELEALDMRTSSVSGRLRRELGTLVTSEEEFRDIYRVAAAFDAEYGRGGTNGEMSRGDRGAAESALRQQIMEMLGPERSVELARQRDSDYRIMQAAVTRLNLPVTAIDTVMTARAEASKRSQQIVSDATLDPGARRAALSAVATEVRKQLLNTMGTEGAEAFAQRAEWLRALERGSAFNLRPEGGVDIQRNRGGGGGGGG